MGRSGNCWEIKYAFNNGGEFAKRKRKERGDCKFDASSSLVVWFGRMERQERKRIIKIIALITRVSLINDRFISTMTQVASQSKFNVKEAARYFLKCRILVF